MRGLPVESCLGKTVRQIFGTHSATLEQTFQLVWDTRRPVRNVQVNVQVGRSPIARLWIGDFFPLDNSEEFVRWIGTVFCEAPKRSGLQQDMLDSITDDRSVKSPRVSRQDAGFVEMEELCAPVLKRTFGLLERSMSLRRQVSEMRLTSSLQGSAWPPRSSQWQVPALVVRPVAAISGDGEERPVESTSFRHRLSKRELEVMRLLVKGKSNKEIAAALTLSPRTVETYRARLMSKLGLHSFADLILLAVRNRLVED